MTPLRILHLVANRWWTGSADPALGLAVALRGRGHHVSFGCIRGDALEARARAAGLPPVEGLQLERTTRPWVVATDVRALRRLVRDERVDVVHTHQSHDHWLAALALRGQPIPLVRTVQYRRAIRRGPATRWLFARSDAILPVSQGILGAARAMGVGADRLTVVTGAVDAERFSPNADGGTVRAELGLIRHPVVGCVSRLVPGRGHDTLLQATALLKSRVPGIRVLLIGRGEGRPAIERLVHRLGLEQVVIFTGYRGDDLPQVLAALDCFALLGVGSEESGRAVLEAMAAGRPVVAGRVGALAETVVEGQTGWLADGRPEHVAERLEAVLRDPKAAQAMGEAGRRRVEALFTSGRQALAVEQIYRGVLARTSSGSGGMAQRPD